MDLNIGSFQLHNDAGYMNSTDWCGKVMGVWAHPGANGQSLLRLLSDGTFLHFLNFQDEGILQAYLDEHSEMQVVAKGDELVARYVKKEKENDTCQK